MAVIDPAALQVMELSSQVLMRNDVIARQRRQIWALVACLRAEQQAKVALIDLLDSVLADLDG